MCDETNNTQRCKTHTFEEKKNAFLLNYKNDLPTNTKYIITNYNNNKTNKRITMRSFNIQEKKNMVLPLRTICLKKYKENGFL